MATTVEIISRKIIKPSSPNPHHPKTLNVTVWGERFPPVYSILMFYYLPATEYHKSSLRLQHSLSDTLNHFYLLAGKVQDDGAAIDCNDYGACFVEARIGIQHPGGGGLRNFLAQPDMDLVNVLDPTTDPGTAQWARARALVVQLTWFPCGGTALAVCVSHKLSDASSSCAFIATWSALCRRGSGDGAKTPPRFIHPSCSPPADLVDALYFVESPQGEFVTRRFVLDSAKLADLKNRAVKSESESDPDHSRRQPTTLDLALGFVAHHVLLAAATSSGQCIVFCAANLRGKMKPPIEKDTMGNLFWSIPVIINNYSNGRVPEAEEIARKVGGELSEFLRDEEKKLKNRGELGAWFVDVQSVVKKAKMGRRIYFVSSLRGLPFYEMDFGWGKPAWFSSPNWFRNGIQFWDSRTGDGIELLVSLDEMEMRRLESDAEFLALALPNPSVRLPLASSGRL